MIGVFGEIVFEVDSSRILTISNYKRQIKHKYSFHEIIRQKSIAESLGEELEEISFEMILMQSAGVDVQETLEALFEMCRRGEAHYLVIGDEIIGENQYVIEEVSENAEQWNNSGNETVVKVDVKLKEYVSEVDEGGSGNNKFYFWN